MLIHFFEPPAAQRVGGLDAAIRSLQQYLVRSGVVIQNNPALSILERYGRDGIAHFHGLWQADFKLASAECRRLGIPYIVSPHGMLEPWAWRHKWWKKWPYFYLRERGHLAKAQALLATGETEARQLKRFFPSASCTVLPLGLLSSKGPNFLSARAKLGWREDERVLLYLSRIHPKKGMHLLLKALVRLGAGGPPVKARLIVVGDGEPAYLAMLQRYVAEKKDVLPEVEWIGGIWGDARWAYFQGADLFCLPTYSENFGLAILEALQVGTRVLTTSQTPWGAAPSWNGGWIVEPEVDEIQHALASFFVKADWTLEQRAKLAEKVHQDYAWEKVGPSYLRFYESVALEKR